MSVKRERWGALTQTVSQWPFDMVKATLPEPQFPEGLSICPSGSRAYNPLSPIATGRSSGPLYHKSIKHS